MNRTALTTIFQDIGGVLLTNGWDTDARRRAAEKFAIDFAEMNRLHNLTFSTYEEGKIGLDEYLRRIVFFRSRPFSAEEFKEFMFSQSQAFPEMIELVRRLKDAYRLKIVAVSNEARELTLYRNREFGLPRFIDFFVSSCFVGLRKPDEAIYRMALDLAQVGREEVVYIENTPMFVGVAERLGIRAVLHTGYVSTKTALEKFGLKLD
jgi:putative hydrolase of the HAD superfamily